MQIDSAAVESGVQQSVLYLSGVGVGYGVDRILGGAFGFGLFTNVLAGYRFLALELRAGRRDLRLRLQPRRLHRPLALRDDRQGRPADPQGARRRRSCPRRSPATSGWTRPAGVAARATPSSSATSATRTPPSTSSASSTPSAPSACRARCVARHQFHDVQLSKAVQCARQALAIDEPRMKFEPCLWEDTDAEGEEDRVRQVWFEGAPLRRRRRRTPDRAARHRAAVDGRRGQQAGTRLRRGAAVRATSPAAPRRCGTTRRSRCTGSSTR